MANHINLVGGKLIISFKYDPALVNSVRSVTGRTYNAKKQHWEIPAENALEAVQVLEKAGFTATLDVKRLVDEQARELALSSEIKSMPAEYAGDLPLFDFQKVGARFLKALPHSLLADVPGLGKTLQTIAATEGGHNRLVFCPKSLQYSWEEEIKKWCPGDSVFVVDGPKPARDAAWNSYVGWTIANYELLLHDFNQIKKHESDHGEWGAIIADEATRISNPSAKTTKALKLLKAKKRIGLTGTPISNSPEDIFSIIDWIAPRYLGSYYQFLDRYCIREPRFNRIVGYQHLNELGDRVSRFMLRRTKEEVLKDFPPKTIENVVFQISNEEAKLYDAVRLQIISEIKELQINKATLGIIPVKMLRLKQCTDHPILLGGNEIESSKMQVLQEILQPILASNDKAIIFTQFAEMAKILYNKFDGFSREAQIIYGDVESEERQKRVNEFNTNPECRIMVMTEAGAYGLNLQAASYVIHYDMPWSVAKLMQREDRAHRIGQTKPVTVYNLIARHTIDEYVAKVLHKKQKISVNILQDEDRLESAGFEEEDIKAILRL